MGDVDADAARRVGDAAAAAAAAGGGGDADGGSGGGVSGAAAVADGGGGTGSGGTGSGGTGGGGGSGGRGSRREKREYSLEIRLRFESRTDVDWKDGAALFVPSLMLFLMLSQLSVVYNLYSMKEDELTLCLRSRGFEEKGRRRSRGPMVYEISVVFKVSKKNRE
ncbi:hypothetical protein HZH68_012549 [Vespula germanica]|uniref:Uncharacterized protein n=1 Tax=Vespula germanica TaxID=30212 RepID=A0A834MXB8_VESGE|nr:hypothetical protein HZH68_012549 [Vespula germanica]